MNQCALPCWEEADREIGANHGETGYDYGQALWLLLPLVADYICQHDVVFLQSEYFSSAFFFPTPVKLAFEENCR